MTSRRSSFRRLLGLLLISCMALTVVVLTPLAAGATVVVSATPNAGIPQNQLIDVTVTGLAPGQVVKIGQCGPDPTGACDGTGDVTADGSGTVLSKLVARPVLSMFWFPSPPPDVDCRVSPCSVVVFDETFTTLASTPLTFTADADPTRPGVTFSPTTGLVSGSNVTATAPAGYMNPYFQDLAMVQCTTGSFPTICGASQTFTNPGDGAFSHPFAVTDLLQVNGFPPFNCRTTSCSVYLFSSIGSFTQLLASSSVLSWGTPPPVHLNIAWDSQNGVTDPIVYDQPGVWMPNRPLTFEQCVANTAICSPVQNHTTDSSGFFSGTVTIFPVAGIGTPQATVCHPDTLTNLCSIKVTGTSGFNSPATFWRGITFADGPVPPVPVVPSGVAGELGEAVVTSALPSEYPGDVTVTIAASPGGESCWFTAPFGSSTTPRSCTIPGLSDGATYDISASASGVWGLSAPSGSSQVTIPGPPFHVVEPTRLVDTRGGPGLATAGAVVSGSPLTVDVTGVGPLPVGGVDGVWLNVTAVFPTAATHLTVWPGGTPMPGTSNLNLAVGDVRATSVFVAPGPDGTVQIANNAGATDVVVDVFGWVGRGGDGEVPAGGKPAAPGRDVAGAPLEQRSDVTVVAPSRVLDTRDGTGVPSPAALTEGAPLTLKVTGEGGVPDSGVVAVVLNLTAVFPDRATHLTAWAGGQPMPLVSNLNLRPGEVRPNLAIVPVGPDGTIQIATNSGSVHVVADVLGWISTGSGSHGALTTHAPDRLLDTRDGTGLPGATPERVGPGQVVSVDLTGKVPEGTRAVVVNLTGTGPNLATHLTAFPAGGEPPLASNLNLGPGQTAANLAMVPLGDDNKIAIRNNVGAVDVVVDLFGYL